MKSDLPHQVKGFDAFDMESYAIASAADFMLDNLYFIKIVSDNLDGSVKDWEASAKILSQKLAETTQSFIREKFNSSYSFTKKNETV